MSNRLKYRAYSPLEIKECASLHLRLKRISTKSNRHSKRMRDLHYKRKEEY